MTEMSQSDYANEVVRRRQLMDAYNSGDLDWRRFRCVPLLPDKCVPPEILEKLKKCTHRETLARRKEAIENG